MVHAYIAGTYLKAAAFQNAVVDAAIEKFDADGQLPTAKAVLALEACKPRSGLLEKLLVDLWAYNSSRQEHDAINDMFGNDTPHTFGARFMLQLARELVLQKPLVFAAIPKYKATPCLYHIRPQQP